MKKILWLLMLAFTLFSCGSDDDPVVVPQDNQGRTVLAFFWADTNTWLNDSLRTNIKYMMAGMQDMTEPATLVVYWDGKETDPNLEWRTPVIVKYEADGNGNINGYSKEEVNAMMSQTADVVSIGEIQKTYPSQTSTDKSVIQTVVGDMMTCHPSDSYGIIFASHGSGWLPTITGRSIGQDGGQSSSDTALIPELAEALQNANPSKFDFVLFDACMMGCAEVCYELRNATKYCIASVLDVPGAGFPYRNLMSYLYADDIRNSLSGICDTYINTYNRKLWGTVAAVDCTKMEDLAEATRSVILSYQDNLNNVDVSAIQEYGRTSTNFKYYASDMVQYIETLCGGEAPADFTSAFNQAVLYAGYTPVVGVGCSLYQIDGDNYCGMGMYIPNALTDSKHELWNSYFKSSIAWYRAAGWADTESIWGN